jgi:cbb3-type cytochrome oxidase subunit 3
MKMKFLLDNIELILSAAGLAVILFVPLAFFSNPNIVWEAAAITAAVVGVLHGVIFWLVRRRQRQVRDEAVREIKLMLQDVINNQLMVITANASALEEKQIYRVTKSVSTISELVESLSEESISDWKQKYAKALETLRAQDSLS